MALNRRHAGGMKSAMDNLKKIDEQIAARKQSNAAEQRDPQRAAYLKKACTCGRGMADACCHVCWPV